MDFKGLRVLVLDGYGKQVAVILESLHKMGCISTTVNCSKLDVLLVLVPILWPLA